MYSHLCLCWRRRPWRLLAFGVSPSLDQMLLFICSADGALITRAARGACAPRNSSSRSSAALMAAQQIFCFGSLPNDASLPSWGRPAQGPQDEGTGLPSSRLSLGRELRTAEAH